MANKKRLFIYDRREMGVLVLLGLLIALFAFTLGVHLGKKVGIEMAGAPAHEASHTPAETHADAVPDRVQLNEQAPGVQTAITETLNESLHEEVTKTGIKLDSPRQVDLPQKTKSPKGGATTLDAMRRALAPLQNELPAQQRPTPSGRYTLQVGSYPNLEEAQTQLKELESHQLSPFLRSAVVEGKGTWYRIYLGGFDSKQTAESAAKEYLQKQMIHSFVIAKMP